MIYPTLTTFTMHSLRVEKQNGANKENPILEGRNRPDTWGTSVALKAEYVCWLVLPGLRAGMSFQEEIFPMLVPSQWGKALWSARMGQF